MTKEKLKQEIEDYLTKDYCCGFKEECKDGVRIRCSEYEAKLYLILRFAEPREKQITILSKHVLDLQKDKGNLIDRCKELEKRCANYEKTISKMEKGTCDICRETEKDKKIEALEQQIEEMKCCANCQTVRDAEGNCYLKKDGKCKDKDKWELRR